jgi:two-component system sensor histidine kinase GlrK
LQFLVDDCQFTAHALTGSGVHLKQREVTDILHQDSLELLALIENLLNFAAWQQHRSQLELSEFDLSELLRGVLKRHSLSIERKQLQVESAIAPTPVVADWDQLRMLFDNLISNAIKFSPTRGGLGISIEVERDTLVVDVCDDGPGIENAEREHVFNPFYQSRVQVQSHVKGTGIGLSVAREVARAHGGNIEIIDHPTAKGACMRVRLPLPVNA